jgi:pyruvate formate lyase activating enzyme
VTEIVSSALITNIQGYSIHDGPGIRTVVFIKGCPLRCKWCANPENLMAMRQVGWMRNLCKQCGRCADACPRGAILSGPDRRIDRTRCNNCGACVDACFYHALVSYGEQQTAQEVFDKVRRDKMFYDASGGGVTVSGGEPLTRPDFVAELFALCRTEQIHTCAETCLCVPRANLEAVRPTTDLFYCDLKLIRPADHARYTGTDNVRILENARYLAHSGARILFRQPIIPTVNATEENILATAAFIRSLGREDLAIELMPYHRMGSSKYAALGLPYELDSLQIMSMEAMERLQKIYENNGVSCAISK